MLNHVISTFVMSHVVVYLPYYDIDRPPFNKDQHVCYK